MQNLLKIIELFLRYKELKFEKLNLLTQELKIEDGSRTLLPILFYNVFGLYLNYIQIKELDKNNNAPLIIEYLKKYPKLIEYKNDTLLYMKESQNKINKIADKILKPILILLPIIASLYILLSFLQKDLQYAIPAITLLMFIFIMNYSMKDTKKLEGFILLQNEI